MSQTQVPTIFSRARREQRDQRAFIRSGTSWLYDAMQEDIAERLDFMRHEAKNALLVGHETSLLNASIAASASNVSSIRSLDEEQPLRSAELDLFVSLARLDSVNDLPGALIHARNALADRGLMIVQIIGAGSLTTLRQVMLAADGDRPAARIHPQIDDRAGTALLQRAGFSKQVVDTHRLTVRYKSLETLIEDLRDQALTSVLVSPAPYVGKSGLSRAQAKFEDMREEDGKVSETFHILTLTGWR
uniref:methyltransferase n=1 Tax=uncultured Altererythrobacter sp. TaxID=500840 RepID=UPI0026074049|nr:methyltransferase [uncultured Altererythrobacter sp.]